MFFLENKNNLNANICQSENFKMAFQIDPKTDPKTVKASLTTYKGHLTRIIKETILHYSHPDIVESLIVQRTDPFFKIVEIRYYTTAAGERLRLGGSDTGKEVFNVVFINDEERRLGFSGFMHTKRFTCAANRNCCQSRG